jgi:hypothetical protein
LGYRDWIAVANFGKQTRPSDFPPKIRQLGVSVWYQLPSVLVIINIYVFGEEALKDLKGQ